LRNKRTAAHPEQQRRLRRAAASFYRRAVRSPLHSFPIRGHLLRAALAALVLGSSSWCVSCADEGEDAFDELALRGSVVDDLTDRGLSGAAVVFVSDTLDESRTVTDGDGHFQMKVELAAQVRLGHVYAEAEGYQPSPRLSVFFDGTERTTELRLRPLVGGE
jgi:hypothetical protein